MSEKADEKTKKINKFRSKSKIMNTVIKGRIAGQIEINFVGENKQVANIRLAENKAQPGIIGNIMKNESFENKVSDIKRSEYTKRTELAMLYLLMEKYPIQVREKIKKPANQPTAQQKTASL